MNKFLRLFPALFFFIFILSANPLHGQKLKSENIPDDVIQTLDFEHGSVKVSQWTLEDNTYIATFKVDGATTKCYIKPDGTFIRTIYLIPSNSLPSAITDYIKANYPLFIISVSETHEEPQTSMYYYLEVRSDQVGALPSVLTFDDMGKLIKRTDPEGFKIPEENYETLATQAYKPKEQAPESKPSTPKKEPAAKPTKTTSNDQTSSTKPAKIKKEEEAIPVSADKEAVSLAEIPAVVQKALTKKVQKPEKLKWYKTEDGKFTAVCIVKEVKNELYFTANGLWDKTYIDLLEEQIPQNILKHLTNFYKGYKFQYGIKELRADKQDKFLLEIIEKKNAKQKLITTIVFDKLGKFLKEYDPNNPDDNEITGFDRLDNSNLTKVDIEIPETVINAFKTKYPKITGVEYSEDEDGYFLASYFGAKGKEIVVLEGNGNIIEIRTAANMDNINVNITDYVKKYLKGFKITEYYAVKGISEKKNSYMIFVFNKKTGESNNYSFTTGGKFIE